MDRTRCNAGQYTLEGEAADEIENLRKLNQIHQDGVIVLGARAERAEAEVERLQVEIRKPLSRGLPNR